MTYLLFVDGDRVGAQIEGAVAAGDLVVAARLSDVVGRAIIEVVRLLEAHGGRVVFVGGDNVLAHAPATDEMIAELLACYAHLTGMTASVGVGTSSNEAYLALKIAKSRGGGQVCWWNRLNAMEQTSPTRASQRTKASPGDQS